MAPFVETPPPPPTTSRNGTGAKPPASSATPAPSDSGAPAVPALLARFQSLTRLQGSSAANAPAATVNTQTRELAAELIDARRQGLFGLLRLRFEAWLEERMQGPILRKMAVRREVMEAQKKTTEAEINLHAAVKGGQKDVERHEIEWNRLRGQRLVTDLERLAIAFSAENDAAAAAFGSSGGNGPMNLGVGIPATPGAATATVHTLHQQGP